MNWLELLVFGAAVPFLVAAAFATLATIGRRREPPAAASEASALAPGPATDPAQASNAPTLTPVPAGGEGSSCMPAAGVTAAFLAAYVLYPWAPLYGESEWQQLPWLLLVVTAVSWITRAVGRLQQPFVSRRAVRWSLLLIPALLTSTLAAWVLVPDWPDVQPVRIWHFAGLGAVLALVVITSELAAERLRPAVYFSGWLLSGVAAAVLIAHAGNLKFAQLEGLVAAACGAMMAVSLVRRRHPAPYGTAFPLAVIHVGLVYLGWMYSFSEIPWFSYACIAAGPALLLAGRFWPRPGGPENVGDRPPAPPERRWSALWPCCGALFLGLLVAFWTAGF